MMKMTGDASAIDDSTRASWLMAGVAVVFALFWETRALVTVQIVEVPAERVLHMAGNRDNPLGAHRWRYAHRCSGAPARRDRHVTPARSRWSSG